MTRLLPDQKSTGDLVRRLREQAAAWHDSEFSLLTEASDAIDELTVNLTFANESWKDAEARLADAEAKARQREDALEAEAHEARVRWLRIKELEQRAEDYPALFERWSAAEARLVEYDAERERRNELIGGLNDRLADATAHLEKAERLARAAEYVPLGATADESAAVEELQDAITAYRSHRTAGQQR